MGNEIIVNAVPAYSDAPVSERLLAENLPLFLERLSSLGGEADVYLLVDKTKTQLIQQVEACHQSRLHIAPVDGSYGFLYRNMAAAKKAVEGESPRPKVERLEAPVQTVEQVLGLEGKVAALCWNGTSRLVTLPKQVSPIELIQEAGGDASVKAVYLGYPMAQLLGEDAFDDKLALDTDYIRVLSGKDCVLQELILAVETFAEASCGQCVFGYEGLHQIHTILGDMASKKGKISDVDLLLELCDVMQTQALCEIGTLAARLVLQAFAVFGEEIKEHITKKNCRAESCRKFVTYHILPDKCTGCTDCTDCCEDDAISGKKKFVHLIDQEECTQCGSCFAVCKYGAVVKAGAVKPKTPKKPIPCTVP